MNDLGWVMGLFGIEEPTDDQILDFINSADHRLISEDGFAIITDNGNGVGYLHTFVAPHARGTTVGYRMVKWAIDTAKAFEIRKLCATIVKGNPSYPGAGKIRGPLGFELEAVLKGQVEIAGDFRDLFIYSWFNRSVCY